MTEVTQADTDLGKKLWATHPRDVPEGQTRAQYYASQIAQHRQEEREACAKVADAEAAYRLQCKQQSLDRKAKGEARDFESMAIAAVQVASAIRAQRDMIATREEYHGA